MKTHLHLLRRPGLLNAIAGLLAATAGPLFAADPDYHLHFSTYLGGSKWEHARDVVTDSKGNVILVGGAAGTGVPASTGAYDTQYNDGVVKGPYAGQHTGCDAFVAKFTPDGALMWCTYLGGPNYDRAYAVEVDSKDDIVVSGRAGPGFPTTAGSFQPAYAGVFTGSTGFYGYQNAFVCKLSQDGTQLLWSSYVGKGELCRGVALDYNDDVFVSMANSSSYTQADPPWFATAFANAYRSTPPGSTDVGIVKIRKDGSQVLWATWFGGSGAEQGNANIRVDRWGFPYLTTVTASADIPVTPGAIDSTFNGANDIHLAKFSKDGSQLLYGTYLGGNGDDVFETHPTAIDRSGNIFVTFGTQSSNIQTTAGAYNSGRSGTTDTVVAKISPTFTLVALAMIGGNSEDAIDGIGTDAFGRVLISGETQSTDFPHTANAHQAASGGDHDAVLAVFDPDLTRLVYSTYLGGGNYDLFRGCFMDSKGNIYGAGASVSTNFPTLNAVQTTYGGSNDSRWGNGDAILVKFVDGNLYAGDSDKDLMPDAWEIDEFGSLAEGGEDDFDHDGDANRLEYCEGTDPKDPQSRLRARIAPGGLVEFSPASSGVDYEIRWSDVMDRPVADWNRLSIVPTGGSPASGFQLPPLSSAPFNSPATAFFSIVASPIP